MLRNAGTIIEKSLYGNYMELPPENKQQVHMMSLWIEE